MFALRPAAVLLAVAAAAAAAETHDVLWQFERESGDKLYGNTLARKLTEVRVVVGDTVRFSWNEGQIHSIYQTATEEEHDNCKVGSGKQVATMATKKVVNLTLADEGPVYLIDSFSNNCLLGRLKIVIRAFTPENFVTLAPTPLAAVTEPTTALGSVQEVAWKYGERVDDVHVTEDDTIRVVWDDKVKYSLLQVTKDAFDHCDPGRGLLKEWSDLVVSGNVPVTGLAVGDNYFLSGGLAHCEDGAMKLVAHVIPGNIRVWASVWTETGATTQPVLLSLIGHDAEARVWVSPERQLNQKATDVDLSVSETVPLTAAPGFFEMFVRNVGAISAVRIRRSNGARWNATTVRINKIDSAEESQAFDCAAMARTEVGAETSDQFCIVASPAPPVAAVAAGASPAAQPCSCFREFTVHEGRVLACMSDGCFSTSSDGLNGWSDMVGAARLVGAGGDGRVYGLDAAGSRIVSRDAGLNWHASSADVLISTPALTGLVNASAITTTPLDAHVVHGVPEWGASAQGIHVNRDGDWKLHGLWSCHCQGRCGLECNQPDPAPL